MKEVPKLENAKSWHGLQIIYTTNTKYVSPGKQKRIILVNPGFWQTLNDYQRFYALTWARYAHKTGDCRKGDDKAKATYKAAGFPFNEPADMLARMTHASQDVKAGRMMNYLSDPLPLKEKWNRFILKINSWLKRIFQKGK